MSSRGPDDALLALRRFEAALLALRGLEEQLVRQLDELQVAQAHLDRAGIASVEIRFGRELTAAVQVRRGEAFWDRPPPDPTPAALTNGSV
jgi:hypothetical protein